ncbi:MAG: hypothetical protein O7G87_19390, partial [bacterium]|nr:hypothetical protein [bacterium]
RFVGAGQLVPQGDRLQVMLTVNDVVLPVGDVEGSDPVTCNWALFDVIPTLADELRSTGEQASLTVLEDLEKIRPDSRIGFLEDWTLPLDGGALELSGFFVYGEGALPSYWWLDREGRVIVVSTIFQTLVLTSRTLGDVA